jgi:RHS repeat-associated protein
MQIATTGFPLTVSRSYETVRAVDGPAGVGWNMNLLAHLYYAAYLYAAPSTYQKEADVVLPSGAQYRFVENADGTFTPPSSRHDILTKNGDGSFDLLIADGTTKYHFTNTGALETIADEFGNALQFTYDANGRLQRVADAAGSARYLDIYFGADGRVSNIQDNTGRQLQYFYDTSGALTSVKDPLNRIYTYTYTTVRLVPLLTRIADNWGRTITDVTYDAQGRTSTYSENGETYTYTYNYNNRPDQASKVDSAGNRWVYTYSPDGPIAQRNYPAGPSEQVLYNADKSVQMITDEVGVKTYYTYTNAGQVFSVTKDYQGPLAVRLEYTYDSNFPARVISILPKNPTTNAYDTNWQGWRYDYYQAGSSAPGALWHTYRVRDDGITADAIATYEYDSHGRATSVTDAAGGRTDYAYDAAGNLSVVTAPANNDSGIRPVTTYGYDALGRVTSVTDALSHQTTFSYDGADRILTVTLPKPSPSSTLDFTTHYAYDMYDSATQFLAATATDPNGNVTTQKYDAFSRLTRSVDAAGNTTSYGYTRALLSSITDANGYATTYSYDGLGQLTRTTFPDGAYETYAYFGDGLLQSKGDRNHHTTNYAYDHLKRLASKSYSNAASIAYTYQGQKLTQVSDTSTSPSETHTFSYDSRYRASSNTQATRGTITYTYDAADRMLGHAISGGPAATYSYYPDGSLDTIQWTPIAGQFRYAYTLTGQYGAITFPNGQTRNYNYDDQGRLTQLANFHPTAGNLATYAYAYDLNNSTGAYAMLGQRTSMTADVPAQSLSSALTKFYYDSRHELTRTDYPSAAPFNGEIHSWTYDAVGNRLTNTINGATTISTYQRLGTNANNWQRISSDGTNSYTYDANGNTVTRGSSTFGWDYDNRMVAIAGGANAAYSYDYSGRRSSKTVSGATTSYLYDGLNLLAETSGGTTTYHLFGPGIDEPLASVNGTSSVFDGVDGAGSVALAADSAGTVQNSYIYDVWGVSRAVAESFTQPFRYTAREKGETPDWVYRARVYTPALGRFLSDDPLGFYDGWNTYTYAGNDPALYYDPLGLARQAGKRECDDLARKIANVRRDIEEMEHNLANNPNNLPFCVPGGKPSASQLGHAKDLQRYRENLDRLVNDYKSKCGGGTPPLIPVRAPQLRQVPKTNKPPGSSRIPIPIPAPTTIFDILPPLLNPCIMKPYACQPVNCWTCNGT